MKSLNVLLIGILILSGLRLKAQEENQRILDRRYMLKSDTTVKSKVVSQGEIKVYQDERITHLDSLKRLHPGKQSGYRVQIFFGDRKEALKRKAEFANSYPDIPAYISYLAPNFRLRVGDFRTRLEAEKLKNAMEYQGCYIVKDKIELPALSVED